MDVKVTPKLHANTAALTAANLIEKCVHCGFCLPACPTYGLEQDERDSPRGRIFLVKELLEGRGDAVSTRTHLDRCLTCRSCETACPSGVEYARIAHYGRAAAAAAAPFGWRDQTLRRLLGSFIRNKTIWRFGRRLAHAGRFALPPRWRRMFAPPLQQRQLAAPTVDEKDQVCLFAGCVQQGLMPESNTALRNLLGHAGYAVKPLPGRCCGALAFHLGHHQQALNDIRAVLADFPGKRNQRTPPVVVAASGCASFMREYPHLDGLSAPTAAATRRLADAVTDPAMLLAGRQEKLREILSSGTNNDTRVTVHQPCTQTNGLRTPTSAVTDLLKHAGYSPLLPDGPPTCCGSAATYSLLHPQYSKRLGNDMADSLERPGGELIASANIGCILQLRQSTNLPVHHWAELLLADRRN